MTKKALTILITNSSLIPVITALLAFQIVKQLQVKKILSKGFTRFHNKYLEKEIRKRVKNLKTRRRIKMGFIEKIELHLIDRSNIRHYIFFMDFYVLLTLCLLIFIIGYRYIYKLLFFIPSAGILSFLISLLPVFILDVMGKYNSEKVRRRLAEFISVLNRWCSVKEDIFYAFEKSIDSDIGEPLGTFVRDMIIQVKRGVSPVDALNILQMKVDNYQFKDFIVNIKQNIRYRGNIRSLLDNLEEQFFEIEQEYSRRKISTYRDRLTIYFIMILVLLTGYLFIKINPQVEKFYLMTAQGKFLVMIFSLLYSLGFYLTLSINKFDY